MEYALWAELEITSEYHVAGVLILVLMEYALWAFVYMSVVDDKTIVLILVLMEYALWVYTKYGVELSVSSGLNPCFNGICSLRQSNKSICSCWLFVLILVLMEYALWAIFLPLKSG